MTHPPNPNPQENAGEAHDPPASVPTSFVLALRSLHAPPPFHTDDLDRAVTNLPIHPPFRATKWKRLAVIATPLAAAAAIALILTLNRPPTDPADLDRDGRITILDAFALARALDAGADITPGWDRNADGRTDTLDADAIALAAVSLDNFAPRGGS